MDPIKQRALALTGLMVGSTVIAVSGFLPWFRSSIGGGAARTVSGFSSGKGNAWYGHVPIGWPLLIVGVVMIGSAAAVVLPRVVRWPTVSLTTVGILAAVMFVFTVFERAHVHHQVHADLVRVLDTYAASQPSQADRARAVLESARFSDAYGYWVAVLGFVAVIISTIQLLRGSRRS